MRAGAAATSNVTPGRLRVESLFSTYALSGDRRHLSDSARRGLMPTVRLEDGCVPSTCDEGG